MSHVGNASFRYHNSALLSVTHIEAPVKVSSAEFEERLAPTRKRLRLPANLLARISGVVERRWWEPGTRFDDPAIEAGAKALAEAGVEPAEVGLLINTSVTRTHLEPSVAARIHDGLRLPTSAVNFDIVNACLGFVNAMMLASTMIDSGQVRYAVVVNSEDSRGTQETTLSRLSGPDVTRADYRREFASLTLGSGAAAAVLGRADEHAGAHRVIGGVSRAGTEHHGLCVGGLEGMFTDTKALLTGGLALVVDAWREANNGAGFGWLDMDRYVTHQISTPYTEAVIAAIDLDPDRVPVTFSHWGNVGPASLPMTLAAEAPSLVGGDRVLCMGVGSGLNAAMLELAW
ncbi:3-oxoacyl-ACP synthase III [Occultella kanbiaonis]|uniref:3-oxoacyl-ACP synthase III n=1 Tax=Occultella kanbiaonis TaxID=2675754 RepID=UPI0012B86879|nr:3-oxoacyl-ACP synthase III [Occultella kanbiaonis]